MAANKVKENSAVPFHIKQIYLLESVVQFEELRGNSSFITMF